MAAQPFTRVFASTEHVHVVVHAPSQLTGPLRRDTRLGTAVVVADGRPVARIPLLLASSLPAVSPLTIAAHFIGKPVMLLLVLLLVACPALAFVMRRRRRARVARGLESA